MHKIVHMKAVAYTIIIIAASFFVIFYISFEIKKANIEKQAAHDKKKADKQSTLTVPLQTKKEYATKAPVSDNTLPFTPQELEGKLHDKDPYRQSEAIAMLELQGGKESINQLEELLKSPTPAIIMESVAALGRMQAKDAVENLEKLYEDSTVRVDGYQQSIRSEIIIALGNIKDEKAIELLGNAFKGKDGLMYKDLLVEAHQKIGSKKSLPYLEEYLKFLEANPGPEDFEDLRFLINKSKERTEQVIEEIKNK